MTKLSEIKNSIVGPFIGEYKIFGAFHSCTYRVNCFDNIYTLNNMQQVIALSICKSHDEVAILSSQIAYDYKLLPKITSRNKINPNLLFELMTQAVYYNSITIRSMNNHLSSSGISSALRATELKPIIHINYWHDNNLGVCLCDRCPGYGNNLYGFILMSIRDMLITGFPPSIIEKVDQSIATQNTFLFGSNRNASLSSYGSIVSGSYNDSIPF